MAAASNLTTITSVQPLNGSVPNTTSVNDVTSVVTNIPWSATDVGIQNSTLYSARTTISESAEISSSRGKNISVSAVAMTSNEPTGATSIITESSGEVTEKVNTTTLSQGNQSEYIQTTLLTLNEGSEITSISSKDAKSTGQSTIVSWTSTATNEVKLSSTIVQPTTETNLSEATSTVNQNTISITTIKNTSGSNSSQPTSIYKTSTRFEAQSTYLGDNQTSRTAQVTDTNGYSSTSNSDSILGLPPLHFGLIVGGSIVLLLIIIILIIILTCKRKKKLAKLEAERTSSAWISRSNEGVGITLSNVTFEPALRMEDDTDDHDLSRLSRLVNPKTINVFASNNDAYEPEPANATEITKHGSPVAMVRQSSNSVSSEKTPEKKVLTAVAIPSVSLKKPSSSDGSVRSDYQPPESIASETSTDELRQKSFLHQKSSFIQSSETDTADTDSVTSKSKPVRPAPAPPKRKESSSTASDALSSIPPAPNVPASPPSPAPPTPEVEVPPAPPAPPAPDVEVPPPPPASSAPVGMAASPFAVPPGPDESNSTTEF